MATERNPFDQMNPLTNRIVKVDVEKETILVKVREYFDITQEQMIWI